MLWRSVLVQKRLLEANYSKCRNFMHKLAHKHGQHVHPPTEHRETPAHLLSKLPQRLRRVARRALKVPSKPLVLPESSPPPEFHQVVAALDSNLPAEQILQFVKESPPLLDLFSHPRKIRQVAEELARSPKPGLSIHILHITHLLGNTLYAKAYEDVSFHVAQGRRWSVVLGVVGAAKNHAQHVTLKLLNWRARALLETKHFALLGRILEEFRDAGIAPTQMTYHIILSGCMRNNDIEGTKDCLLGMQDAGILIDSTTHSLIASHRNFNDDPQVRRSALDSLPTLGTAMRTSVVNRLIQLALDEEDLTTALQYLSMFQQERVTALTSVFRSLPGAVEKSVTAVPMYLEPNADTFAVCMNYFIKKSNPEFAIRLGTEPFLAAIPPTPGLVTSLIHAYFLGGRGDTAVHMLRQLSSVSYTKGWRFLLTESWLTAGVPILNPAELSLTTRMCNALLRGSLKRHGLSSVPYILAIMHADNIIPNERTVEILLSYMNDVNISHPRTFFQLLRAFTSTSPLRPALPHMHTIVSRIFRKELESTVPSTWTRRNATVKGVRKPRKPRLIGETKTFDPLSGIQLTKHLRYRTAARPIVQSLSIRQVKADSPMIFLRMRRQAVLHLDMESAKRLLRTLSARGFRPNAYHVGALVEGYSHAGMFAEAKEIMKTAQIWGVKPNIVMYTSLISGYARRQKFISATKSFEEMVGSGIPPDVPSIDALVGAAYSSGRTKQAHQLLMGLWDYIQPFPKSLEGVGFNTLRSHFRSLGPPQKLKYKKQRRIEVFHHVSRITNVYQRYFGFRRKVSKRRNKNAGSST